MFKALFQTQQHDIFQKANSMNRIHIPLTLLAIACGLFWTGGELRSAEKETKPPAVGKKAPDFELPTLEGKKHKLSKLIEEGPVVVVMLRGFPTYQCPLCSRQMTEFLNAAKGFNEQKSTVVFVYPDNKDGVAEHAQQFIKGKKFPPNFLFLLDPDFAFTNAYGLRWEGEKETSYPSTFIIDGDQKVTFAKISRSHGGRTKAKEIIAELGK
ncbi:thiol-disulfide oxidoreductase [Symmachiella dynata]|uniref:Thiol-disulfide oxidoreductase n=2 Tax=Symmachiella dynata TaxID=2527995 RepID=A0A517ZXK3_9PLAN|nr:thiol-disulfide oxidoreductase [Symmachiella dynata]